MIPKQTHPNIPEAGTIFSEHRFQTDIICTLTIHTLSYGAREPGFFFPGESHEAAELLYLDRGTLHTVTGGAESLLQPGELILYGPDRWHTHFAEPDQSPRFLNISFTCSIPLPEGLFGHKRPVSSASEMLLQQILQEIQTPDRFSPDMLSLLLQQLLVVLQREERPEEGFSAVPIHNENEIILRAQRYIAAQARQKLSVPLVARNVNVSPSYLTALFHKHLRIAPAEYIRRTKLQESKRLIRETDMTFTEIAAALQYSTVHHFSRQFKEKFGITPTEYAKSVGAIQSNS